MIETERLILRPPQEYDFGAFAKAQANVEFKKHTGGAINRVKAREDFEIWRQFWQLMDYGFFSIIDKETNQWVGRVGPTLRANSEFPEFGWSIIPSFQGKGYAQEAAIAVIKWAQSVLNWQEAYFCISKENLQSQKLASKLGAIRAYQEKLPKSLQNKGVEVWQKPLK